MSRANSQFIFRFKNKGNGVIVVSDKVKEIVLKTLLVIEMVLIFAILLANLVLPFFVYDYETISNTVLILSLVDGGLFIILLPILGGMKRRPVKADRMPIHFKSYDELISCLEDSLCQKGYRLQNSLFSLPKGQISVYVKQTKSSVLDSFTVIRVPELSEEMLEIANNSITKILLEYYDNKRIRDTVNMISLFCVDRITPTFKKLVNCNINQGLKNGRLVAGVSLGGKNVYIAKQVDGFAIAKYKRMRKTLVNIMKLNKVDHSIS